MSASVDHDFNRGFVLDELRVRKIHELITSRLEKLESPPKLVLKVYRGDSYVYETQSVADVLNEDNDDWRAIVRLEFIAETEDDFYFMLRFSPRETSLNILGDDRDTVFLIFSDVREYVRTSVLSGTKIAQDTFRISVMLMMLVGLLGFSWSLISSVGADPKRAAEAIANANLEDKLNYLINARVINKVPFQPFGWLVLMTLSMVGTVSGIFEKGWNYLFPSNLFCLASANRFTIDGVRF